MTMGRVLEIHSRQLLGDDAAVWSEQSVLLPAVEMSAGEFYQRYLAYLRRVTLGMVRPGQRGDEVRFLFLGLPLITFSVSLAGESEVILRIVGGFLVDPARCHRGLLTFRAEPHAKGVRLTLSLADYCPLILGSSRPSFIRKECYRLTQAAIHRLVTVRFLRSLCRELVGKSRCRLVTLRARRGEEDI
ncbi:MAG TPA: hypothetical protein VFR01_03000 [Geobacterales bacterium]|nr:hypothetical protein [Geobacterales bacterium]